MNIFSKDTITAIATPPGFGGVGIVRISGELAKSIAIKILGHEPKVRYADYSSFLNETNETIDEGIALYFQSPRSFTGEDVVELQAHGGPIVLDQLLKTAIHHGARLAEPGEFSLRAYLNNKLDLNQAEAINALIHANSEQAARSAVRSLQGEFSSQIQNLVEALIKHRVFVEAAIDFPEEEIDFVADSSLQKDLEDFLEKLIQIKQSARQGVLLEDGLTVVIAGKPNAGKSSLLNALSGEERAIVTSIEGTTRDVLREKIVIDGLPIHIIDTAGLRETDNEVEKIGVQRAKQEIEKADLILLMVDASQEKSMDVKDLWPEYALEQYKDIPLVIVKNKIDLSNDKPEIIENNNQAIIQISAAKNQGLDLLTDYLENFAGFNANQEGLFIARRRHLDSLAKAETSIKQGLSQLTDNKSLELLAEDLRHAQDALSKITGEFRSDDLLGEIFSSFCIGK